MNMREWYELCQRLTFNFFSRAIEEKRSFWAMDTFRLKILTLPCTLGGKIVSLNKGNWKITKAQKEVGEKKKREEEDEKENENKKASPRLCFSRSHALNKMSKNDIFDNLARR